MPNTNASLSSLMIPSMAPFMLSCAISASASPGACSLFSGSRAENNSLAYIVEIESKCHDHCLQVLFQPLRTVNYPSATFDRRAARTVENKDHGEWCQREVAKLIKEFLENQSLAAKSWIESISCLKCSDNGIDLNAMQVQLRYHDKVQGILT